MQYSILQYSCCPAFQRYEMREMHGTISRVLQRMIASKYFVWFGVFVAVCNVICISVSIDTGCYSVVVVTV